MKKIAQGDSASFVELVNRYHNSLILYSTRILGGDRAKAEDMIQNVWAKIALRAPEFCDVKNVRSWILRVVRNACISELRSVAVSRHDQIEDKNEGEVEKKLGSINSGRSEWLPAEENLIKNADEALVRSAIDSLGEFHRIALLTWLEEDDFVTVLSSELNLTANAVHQLIYRAKKHLKESVLKKLDEEAMK